MVEQPPDDSAEIKETDIVFDCPYCGKSLAIDYRGAGLTIQCTDCGRNVVVPIPEGMELADLDGSDEDREIQILNLRRSLVTAENKIIELESQIKGLAERCDALEKSHSRNQEKFAVILEKVAVIQRAQTEIFRALELISDVARDRK
ncbi:MAG: hypothetical protein ACUVWX_03820 [Kiritimatiellia bacterium]